MHQGMCGMDRAMDEYSQLVRTRALERDGQPLYNASVDSASVVIENLFKSANRKIDILSGDLNPRVYGRSEVVEEAMLFLISNPEHRIRVLLEKDLAAVRKLHPFFKMFSEFGNVELRIAPSELQKKYTFHFVVVDKDCYRFESNKELPAATVAFGDLAGAGNLSGIYDRLWNQSVPAHMIPEA